MILAFFKYCYFWIDILGFLTYTFEPDSVCLVMECPPGVQLCQSYVNVLYQNQKPCITFSPHNLKFIDLIWNINTGRHRTLVAHSRGHRCTCIHSKYVWALNILYRSSCVYKTKHCANKLPFDRADYVKLSITEVMKSTDRQ